MKFVSFDFSLVMLTMWFSKKVVTGLSFVVFLLFCSSFERFKESVLAFGFIIEQLLQTFILSAKFRKLFVIYIYRISEGKDLRLPRETAPFRGTTRYASVAALSEIEQSRKDDLEVLFLTQFSIK